MTRGPVLEVDVDRERARFGAWYELFPRSWGGFKGVESVLPELADLGFDVVYLPPIHPIGTTNRKGKNNALVAAPGDPGSPWAIGSEDGGHTAVAPGARHARRLRSARRARRRARRRDRPRLRDPVLARPPVAPEHPEWFHRRPDGTLKYAENPPKRYQDIYNVNFGCEDWRGLWKALRDVVLFWVDARRPHLPRRQPAHEAARVLGMADPGGSRARSRRSCSWPRRSRGRCAWRRSRRPASRSPTRTSRGRTRSGS